MELVHAQVNDWVTLDQRYNEVLVALTKGLSEVAFRLNEIEIEVTEATSLVDDLGIDSLHLVEVAICIEERTGVTRFSLEDWVEQETLKKENRFSVGALARAVAQSAVSVAR